MLKLIKKVLAKAEASYTHYVKTPVRVYWNDGAKGSRVFGAQHGYFEAKSYVRGIAWGHVWCYFNPWGEVNVQRPGTELPPEMLDTSAPALTS